MMKDIVIENANILIKIIPELGGKIASIYRKDKAFELLFQGEKENVRAGDSFGKSAWGFDDTFPNIDKEELELCDEKVLFPDHGEIWSSQMEAEVNGNVVTMRKNGDVFNYEYVKTVYLLDDGINIAYSIRNLEKRPYPCIWTMHCLVNCEENMQLIYPRDTHSIENVKKSRCLGDIGDIHTFPISKTGYNFCHVGKVTEQKFEKFYINHKFNDGSCGIYYPNHDINFKIEFDAEKLPYLGVWIDEGGYKGDYNCAFEPSNGYYDKISTAMNNDKIYYLNDKLEFDIKLTIK